ncbi:MAG: hypothetical protein HZA36_00030 [Parcubacteria group bacterium]|nr:hypothetical protein [Parcubacteria group bacterium]
MKYVWIFIITVMIIAAFRFSGTGLQVLAGIMTIILHPWVLSPIVVGALILVFIWNAFFGKKSE